MTATRVHGAVGEARRSADLTEKELARRLGISLWEMERLEGGEIDATPYISELERHTGRTADFFLEDNAAGPPDRAGERPAAATEEEPPTRLDNAGQLVLGSIAALVLIRIFTETLHVLPRALNVVDIPVLVCLVAAAALSSKPSPRLDRFSASLLPLTLVFLVLTALAFVANPSRVALGPTLVLIYGVLGPFAIYRSVLRIWPVGSALSASRLLVGLGVTQLIAVVIFDLPRFVSTQDPDVISGTFGTNAYQFVFFMVLFIALVAGIYSFEPERLPARFAFPLIAVSFAFIVLAQYRALLIPIGLALLLVFGLLSARRNSARGFLVAGIAMLAFASAVAFGAQKLPVLKLGQTLNQNPIAVAGRRLDIVTQLRRLYAENPRYALTGTGPGTYSSRGWQTFALSDSKSNSNSVGPYALALTGGETYTTDVSDKYVRPLQGNVIGPNTVVAGSRAANSPFLEYTSIAAELGVLGLGVLLALYLSAFVALLRRTRAAIRDGVRGDPLPALLLATLTGLFVLLQMGLLDNWLEVTRLTFPVWALAAIAIKEFDARSDTTQTS